MEIVPEFIDAIVYSTQICYELVFGHSLRCLAFGNVGLVQICIQHDDGKRNEEDRVLVLEGTVLNITSIIFPVALAECRDDSINLLRLAW